MSVSRAPVATLDAPRTAAVRESIPARVPIPSDGVALLPTAPLPALTRLVRAAMLLGVEGASVGLAVALELVPDELADYVTRNSLRPRLRLALLNECLVAAVVFAALAVTLAIVRRRHAPISATLLHIGRRLAPLGVVGLLPVLFRWKLWEGRDLQFLALASAATFAVNLAVKTAVEAGPWSWEAPVAAWLRRPFAWSADRLLRLRRALPLVVVCAGSLAYTLYFSYTTLSWHWSVRSGYDLALENNLMWNLVHGGPFFKSSPLVGPKGSHFGYHATLFAYVMAPIYALAPRAETLLVIQSTLLGFAAVPLFLFARLHVKEGLACVISLAYLLYPGLHGANLYEFHYLPLGTFFLWLTLYALEARLDKLAVLAVLLTLSVREDVSASLAIWGAYLLVTGRRPGAGLVVVFVSAAYFLTMKMGVMPRFAADKTESFTFIYQKLLPQGENSFGAVIKTAIGNPGYTLDSMLEEGKLVYLLQIFVPLGFVPLRRALSLLLALPGILFTLLSTAYPPTISIHYQYTAHWTTFMFVASVLALASLERAPRIGATAALLFGLVTTSYQYGSVLQTHTSWGGPIRYKFGINAEDRRRRHGLDEVLTRLPKNAKVSCSGFVTPQVSSRADAYSMTLGVYDAEYLLFPSEKKDFIVDERTTVTKLLESGQFGVVIVSPPFALARRGYSTEGNAELLSRIR